VLNSQKLSSVASPYYRKQNKQNLAGDSPEGCVHQTLAECATYPEQRNKEVAGEKVKSFSLY
jgi:hypothetical protein